MRIERLKFRKLFLAYSPWTGRRLPCPSSSGIRSFSSSGNNGSTNWSTLNDFWAGRHWRKYSTLSPKHDTVEQEGNDRPGLHRRKEVNSAVHDPTPETESSNGRSSNPASMEAWRWLGDYGPAFSVKGSQITVIQTPTQFYEVLLENCSTAKKRVTLASLYLGTGTLEQQLVASIKENLDGNASLKVKVLLDFARGSRGQTNSRTLLLPLVRRSNTSCLVYLYHTPTLRGLLKRVLPQRWNELIGLQHMKVYIFDNSVLISGANLSNDYFTNRQDRYFLISNAPELANFYDGLISSVAKFSFQLNSLNNVELHSGWAIHPADGDSESFVKEAKTVITNYYIDSMASNTPNSSPSSSHGDTWIFPMIQMGPLQVSFDDKATKRLLESLGKGSVVKLATGYFNLTPDYIQRIIHKSAADFEILMAHPKANGFLGAKFPAGGIPAAYTLLATRVLDDVKKAAQAHRIRMYEYSRPSWTFHAKGLWLYPSGESLPSVTLVGSPNFGYRSVYRDLETQLYIVTSNQELRKSFESEQQRLYALSSPFDEAVLSQSDRSVPLWVRMVIRYFKNFF